MFYPDGLINYSKKEFAFATLTNQEIKRTYLYCLKFNELDQENNNGKRLTLPFCIVIESDKEDIDQFRILLSILYNSFLNINSTLLEETKISYEKMANYKKVEIMNIFAYLCSNLYKPGPHTTIQVTFPFIVQTVDFYFSSNCEIPCNKTDSIIGRLFSYLDLSIILKIIFKILAEKSVVLISSDPSVLHAIFPALIKLIFPITWIYSYVPILPQTQEGLLELPNQHLFGYLKKPGQKNEDIVKSANEEFVVDCDTNEIYKDKKYVDFCPLPCSDLISPAKVLLKYADKKLQRFIPGKKKEEDKLTKVIFLKEGKVIIDCDNDNKLQTELEDSYLKNEESSQLRSFVQKIKRSNFFQAQDQMKSCLDKFNTSDIDWDENKEKFSINHNKSYEHQLNELFAQLINSKITTKDDPLFTDIKHFNSYHEYISSGKYQNDSNINIIKNYLKSKTNTKFKERNFANSLKINYNILHFPKDPKVEKLFENQKQYLNDYFEVREVLSNFYHNVTNVSFVNSINLSGKGSQINIYGKNGFLEFCEQFMKCLDKKSEFENLNEEDLFYIEWYKNPIFEMLCSNGDGEYNIFPEEKDDSLKESDEKIIDFNLIDKDGNEQVYQQSHQYLYFLSVLYQEYKKNNYKKKVEDSVFINEIIKYQIEASKKDEYDFSFINFDIFLHSLSLKEINKQTLKDSLINYEPFKEIYDEVLKEKLEEEKTKK